MSVLLIFVAAIFCVSGWMVTGLGATEESPNVFFGGFILILLGAIAALLAGVNAP